MEHLNESIEDNKELFLYPRLSLSEDASHVTQEYPLLDETVPSEDHVDSQLSVLVASTDKLGGSKRIWYKIDVAYKGFSWTINKKMSDIMGVAWALRLMNFQQCNELTENSEEEVKVDPLEYACTIYWKMLKEEENVEYFTNIINNYLKYIVSTDRYRDHQVVLHFLGISKFSFLPELGEKGREGPVEKRSSSLCLRNARWINRWLVLKKKTILYTDESKKNIEGVFMLDHQTNVVQNEDRIAVKNSSHVIFLKFPTIYDAICWKTDIEENTCKIRRDFERWPEKSVSGFSPVRMASAQWFVDGADYFSSVADSLERAEHEIFISAWFLGPHIYLKRLPKIEEKWMLKSVLKRKADEGVKIYVLLYDAPDGFIKLGDQYVKDTLEELNKKNIRVVRHRGNILGKTILWSHHEKLVVVDQMVAYISGIDLTSGRWDTHEHRLTDAGIDAKDSKSMTKQEQKGKARVDNGQQWPGIDYANDYESTKMKFHKPFRDHIDRTKIPRTPWHDIACVIYGSAAKDVARHFIQKWNFIKTKERRSQEKTPFLILKDYWTRPNHQTHENPLAIHAFVQVLRSAPTWSVGVHETESSIAVAYERAIDESQHYIYIENQFFVSQNTQEIIKNTITSALRRRILRAEQQGTTFRIYIVLPLIPMFEGDFSKADKSQQIRIFAHYQYHSISRGESSLIGSLKSLLKEDQIDQYISFCSLRTYGKLNEKFITEVLYVHSKLLIVDDRIAIIGSPNINDRSLMGNRDSEVAVWIKDSEMVASTMNGQPYEAGRFAFSLRRRLFAEHLGLLDNSDASLAILDDIVSGEFYNSIWKQTAKENTDIYSQVFRSFPTDDVRRFSQVQRHQMKEKKTDGEVLRKIRGFLVKFPMQYLESENLIEDRSGLLPIEIFT